jgi:hypothetical protein
LHAAAAFARAELELVVAWEGQEQPPESDDVRYLDVFPGGLGNARNRALEVATQALVAFVDDDEIVDEGWVKGLLSAFERPPWPDGVFGAIAPADDVGKGYRVYRGANTPPWHVGSGGNMAFRRDVLLEAGGFDPTFGSNAEAESGDETELVLRLLRAGRTLVWAPDMRVYHPSRSPGERRASREKYAHGMGRALRRHRRAVTIARYLAEVAHLGELRAFVGGVVSPRTWRSPRAALALAPPDIRARLEGERIVPLPAPDRPRPHLLYLVGDELVLHAYGSPRPEVREALRARGMFRLQGVPAQEALADGRDSIWLLEERLRGRHPEARSAHAWFDRVADWSLDLAGSPGPPLATTSDWQRRTEAMHESCPAELRSELAHALAAIGGLGAVRIHGDLSRKNVLLDGTRVGAVDWEECSVQGVPGRDLLFLAVGARGDRPAPDVIVQLARGEEPPFGHLLDRLAAQGVGCDLVPPLLFVVLAGWAADEARRLSELGATARGSRPYLELLTDCAGVLVSRR